MGFTIDMQGLKELAARVKAAPAIIQKEVGIEIKDGAQAIAAEVKQRAPGNIGDLQNLIAATPVNELSSEVVSAANYSAFVEFGTGQYVSIPEGLEDYAAQFKGDFSSGTLGSASGLTAWEAISAWCRDKGIEEQLWYPIYVSILQHGIHAQPFFFVSVAKQEPIIVDKIQKVLERI